MVGYADEYEINEDRVLYRGSWDWIGNINVSPLYPLLLQRAIEGVNHSFSLDTSNYEIKTRCYGQYEVHNDYNIPQKEWTSENIDQSKEQALKYIYEKENNNA